MYTSESGAKYRKARESRSRSYPDMDKVYNDAKKSFPARTKALEKKKSPFSEKFVNTWRERHGSNVGLDSPSAHRAYKEHLRREKIDKGYK